ncbi:MAG: SIMPL domain-containing protein, partial [Herbaspirillum sp.]
MLNFRLILVSALLLLGAGAPSLYAQTVVAPVLASTGALLVVPAFGELTQANDQVRATFMVEEQNKDKAVAASLVNKKMKLGTGVVRRADPSAVLKTRGYYTYPVYAEEGTRTQINTANSKTRQLIGWRVGQYLDMTTTNLDSLAKTVAAVQNTVALNGLQFGLSDVARKRLDSQLILATYQNLTERVATIARAMGRNVADA